MRLGEGGQNPHVHEGKEGQAFGLDARELGRLFIASQRIDAPSDDSSFSDEGVNHDQHAHGHHHIGQAPERGQFEHQEHDGGRNDRCAGPEQASGLIFDTVLRIPGAFLHPHTDHRA